KVASGNKKSGRKNYIAAFVSRYDGKGCSLCLQGGKGDFKMIRVQVSVVIPVYNEEANLTALMGRLLPVMNDMGKSFEVILIDDGSQDNSLKLLKEFASTPRVRVVELTRNYGQHAAIMAGFS